MFSSDNELQKKKIRPGESSSSSEEEEETAADKRLRLAKEYLSRLEAEGTGTGHINYVSKQGLHFPQNMNTEDQLWELKVKAVESLMDRIREKNTYTGTI